MKITHTPSKPKEKKIVYPQHFHHLGPFDYTVLAFSPKMGIVVKTDDKSFKVGQFLEFYTFSDKTHWEPVNASSTFANK